MTAGLAIYDTMQYILPPVSTWCVGQAASMGSLLLASGTPGKQIQHKFYGLRIFFDLLDCKYFIPCTKIYFSTFRNATFIAKLSDVSKLNFLDMSNVHLLIAIKVLTHSVIVIICIHLYTFASLEWYINHLVVHEVKLQTYKYRRKKS